MAELNNDESEQDFEKNDETEQDLEITPESGMDKDESGSQPSTDESTEIRVRRKSASQKQQDGEDEEGNYDYKTVYASKIEPYVKEILLLCDQYHIPAFMTFAVANSKKETKYASEVLSEVVEGRDLHNDLIRKHVLVMSGFDVVPEQEEMIIEELL